MSYSTGTVYKIICRINSDIVYIGSTFNSLRNRWQCHKSFYKEYLKGGKLCMIYPYFEKYGIENFKIIKVKEYECYRANRADSKHLQAYEQLWINKTKGCVNKSNPFRINKLSKKQYREDNKDKVRERAKIYYENNKEQITEKKKIYREKNKEHIRKQDKIYYENNKEEIKEKKSRTEFCIACKCQITIPYFKQHTRSQKHVKNAQKIIYNFLVKYSNQNVGALSKEELSDIWENSKLLQN